MKKQSLFSDEKRIKILFELEKRPKKFVQLKKLINLESNILSYNINILIKEKLVNKKGIYYELSDYGRYLMPYVHKFNDASLIPMPCIAVIIRKSNKILIRTKDKEPGKGMKIFIGGKMNLGEDIFESAKRHANEKVGIDIKNLKVICVNNYVSKKDNAIAHYVVFFITAEPLGKPKKALWLKPDKIKGKMFPDNRFIIDKMLNNKSVKIINSVYDENLDEFKVVNIS